jgi:hypothetical protein
VPDIYYDVDTALSEVPVNVMPLTDDTDFKTRETAVAYNAAGMDLVWNFCTSAGAFTQTAVTPTTGGTYDWTHQGGGMYTIEMPASGGASINNDSEGYGWFTGYATGVLPWRSPVIGFRAAALNDALLDGGASLTVNLSAQAKLDVNAEVDTAISDAALATAAAVDAVPTATENADALLNRDMASVSDSNSRSPLNALRFIRNGFTTAGTVVSVLKEDDTTVAYTRDLTTDAAAEPITSVS